MTDPYEPKPRRRRLRLLGLIGLLALAVGVLVLVVILAITASQKDAVIRGPHEVSEPAGQTFPDAVVVPRADVDAGAPELDTGVTQRPTPRPGQKGLPKLRRIRFSELRKIQRNNKPLLNACYARVVRKKPQLRRTKVNIIVVLKDGGEIAGVDVSGNSDPLLVGCVGRAVKSFSFPPDLRAQRVTFPVLFVSGSAG